MNGEDLSSLKITDIDSILSHISSRHESGLKATQIGSDVLIVVAPPAQDLSVTDSNRSATMAELRWSTPDAVETKGTANLLDVATSAFQHMLNAHEDQSIVVRGDSGSGKTNARKLLVQQLVALAKNTKKNSKVLTGALKMESVLQAFGHAALGRDSVSSSRYGLYSEYQYSANGRMVGIKTLDYLFEKNRITGSAAFGDGERNFNIFYQLLSGLTSTEREKLFLAGESGHYNYLHASKISNGTLSRKKSLRGTLSRAKNTTTHANAATPEDSTQFAILREHLKSLGVGKKLQSFIFQVVAAVLHIGNLQFANDPMKPQDPAAVKNRDVLLHACTLLGVSESDLEQLMTYQTKMIGMELCSVIMTLDEANDRRDELSRALYSLLFSWLLTKINDRLCKEEAGVDNFISILDFPSLKTMDQNTGPLGFYDFCSNIAYERITQFMDSKTITGRDIAYKGEMLSPPPLEFIDHTAILKLLTGPSGIATCINEETCANQNAETLTNALNSQFTRSENYIPSSRCSPNMSSPESEQNFVFGIRHNFARVEYTVNDFKHRNLEVISSDFVAMFQNANNAPTPDAKEDESFSINIFLANLFSTKMGVEVESKGGQIVSAKMNATLKRNPSIKKKGGKSAQKSKTISTSDTALSNLITTLDDLMVCISNTKIYLVLCVNPFEPNIERISMSMLRQQLESLSVPSLATSRAFANVALPGITYDEFEAQFGGVVAKYANISDGIGPAIDQIAKKNKWNPRDLILGRTQMFLSDARWRWFKSHAPVEMPDLQRRNSISESVASFQDGTESPNYSADAFEVESEYGGELGKPAGRREDKVEFGAFNKDVAPPKKEIVQAVEKITGVRKAWVCITWSLTWWIPSIFLRCCGKMKRPDIRMAWREKVALCILIFLLNASLLFVIIGLRYIICPPLNIKSEAEISDMGSPWVSAQGRYYQVQGLYDTHMRSLGEGRGQSAGALAPFEFTSFYGKNVGGLFFKQDTWGSYCPNLPEPQAGWDYLDAAVEPKRPLPSSPAYNAHRIYAPDGRAIPLIEGMRPFVKGSIGYTAQTVQGISSSTTVHVIIYNNVYLVTRLNDLDPASINPEVREMFNANSGKDVTAQWKRLSATNPDYYRDVFTCLNNIFYVGTIDDRDKFQCTFSNYILLSMSVILVSVILFKFLAALRCTTRKDPDEHDKFVVLMVPCYTEGQESLAKTLESLAAMTYDDKRKLLFVVCDGMIVGAGNDRPTPRIVLDILGVDRNIDPEPQAFLSLGEGNKQFNMAKVYSGLYEIRGHSVPFVVVVKVGGPTERVKPGNRGKRDSQLVLMRFFNRVHFNAPLAPMELDLFHHMKNIIGVSPTFYEFVLMVDADTEVEYDALNRMVSLMVNDGKVMGLCGETTISNEKTTWVTMIQVYEYFISHHLAKAFESLFGTVTCLPGCFCMYRLRSAVKNVPLLVSNAVLHDYAENNVNTLHTKNLLHLGEDRYLTTLMLKHFPQMRTSFHSEAKCHTVAPDRWDVLQSQRRRWINSTVHNLIELTTLGQLCGFCCFSMRFVVMIDLLATFVQPATVLYVFYLIYAVSTGTEVFPLLSILLIVAVYGLQIVIFLIKREWQHIIWMIIYIIAMPIFSLWIPCYSFWHFDDFSWGNTRVVVGEGKKTIYVADAEAFDPDSVPCKLWQDHEGVVSEQWEKGSVMSGKDGAPGYTPSVAGAYPPGPGSVASGYEPSLSGGYDNRASMMMPYGAPPPMAYAYPMDNRMSMMSAANYSAPVPRAGFAQPPSGSASPRPVPKKVPAAVTQASAAPPPSASASTNSKEPTDEQLLAEIKGILATANLMTLTKKQVREDLSARFGGQDLKPRRAAINAMIDDVLQGM